MPFDKPLLQTSDPYRREGTTMKVTRTIYYGEVISIDDETDGGRIKVRIWGLDTQFTNDNLPWCYPLLPRFFHLYPQVGEVVRVFIEDIKYPERTRFWLGSVISQPQKISFDSTYNALSTSSIAFTAPEASPSTYPEADGVFPLKSDVAIVGKVNTDIILKINEVHIRAGKHENNDILKLNKANPAQISLTFEQSAGEDGYKSNVIIMSDKIGIISHSGNPQFKHARLDTSDREEIFEQGHPMARGDALVQALEVMRKAIISHIHGYSNLSADKSAIINDLENLNLENILQKNIVIN